MFTRSLVHLSAFLLALVVLEIGSKVGMVFSWQANTLAQRLVDSQGVRIGLIALLGCAQLLRVIPERRIAANAGRAIAAALVLAAIASAVFFDPILCLLLCLGAAPVWREATALHQHNPGQANKAHSG
ncbi:hypothetical protein EYS42_16825 [Aquabacterium lacunae]|uniref:Uncharacterized protein n=1 Tax=Aquabacterium lacunae TaxID=2528630 RepID=A0A4Q9GUC5_9BURK|nr:hypothetical protein [Aquabacterium lacunae]TBO27373.1 hypothetical protein EYS42_16825 [Aquabacterium lacunae]